ncbi:MAG TPA: O-antigen ligase family protein [Steroidobacteraceae bacterium]|nr:O-antigen ligase family protein [Steroidobacteraceae bacterium]
MDAAVREEKGQRALLKALASLCFLAMLFASGDIWPSVTLGFNFRFSQVCLFAALALCPVLVYRMGVRTFPGWAWLYGFALWLFATLPHSLFITRSIGYTFWAVTDILLVFVFVQTFRTEPALVRLIRYVLITYTCVAVFGLVQFALGLLGIDLLITQWWIPGVLPRINGISYEPSYFATYLLGGWVLANYLLERRAPLPNRKLIKLCAVTTTAALLLATSRLGWGMMLLWLVFRFAKRALLTLAGRRMRPRTAGLIVASPLLLGVLLLAVTPVLPRVVQTASEVSFLLSGLGMFGEPAHSAVTREGDVRATWRAFTAHPFTGTGIGAVPVEIAAARFRPVRTLEDAKPNEGMSIFVELLAGTGIVGTALFAGFGVAVANACRRALAELPPWRAEILRGVAWSVLWVVLALQFSQNILRIWLFIAIAVLLCCLTADNPRRARYSAP